MFGVESVRYATFSERCGSAAPSCVETGIALLRSAKDGVENGALTNLESLVSADVFSDFLDMARHLHDGGYKDAAAVLAGSVLENGLRRVAAKRGLTGGDIKTLNDRLAQAGEYNRLTQKRVQVWNDIRNQAAHGNFDEYDTENVQEMLDGVASLLERFL